MRLFAGGAVLKVQCKRPQQCKGACGVRESPRSTETGSRGVTRSTYTHRQPNLWSNNWMASRPVQEKTKVKEHSLHTRKPQTTGSTARQYIPADFRAGSLPTEPGKEGKSNKEIVCARVFLYMKRIEQRVGKDRAKDADTERVRGLNKPNQHKICRCNYDVVPRQPGQAINHGQCEDSTTGLRAAIIALQQEGDIQLLRPVQEKTKAEEHSLHTRKPQTSDKSWTMRGFSDRFASSDHSATNNRKEIFSFSTFPPMVAQ
ncbi:hypothetical protein PoB_006126400 [Plakobranchus ocellatus]|uniref:Uncharacterized protein n=1 Tax=Plakobranchus ocellatus TaxID=259542 RepID=A0AAV4CS94_9GAST|nr:hypothetical protein PoB_006126400 [Plakobranchus ocellatus]